MGPYFKTIVTACALFMRGYPEAAQYDIEGKSALKMAVVHNHIETALALLLPPESL
jgi:hypothetical protein